VCGRRFWALVAETVIPRTCSLAHAERALGRRSA
jgi:hypothetical protein